MDKLILIGHNAAYIGAIALQLAAALLLVGNSDIKRQKIIREYCDKHTAFVFKKDGTMVGRDALEVAVKGIWVNRISFIYLFIGYLIGIFGNCTIGKLKVLLIVCSLVFVLFVITQKYAQKMAKQFPSIKKDEIPDKDGVTIIDLDDK